MIWTLGVLPSAMTCKICGELCRCSEPIEEVSRRITFSDLDPYDPSEEQFASSLSQPSENLDQDEEAVEPIATSNLAESLQRARSAGHGEMNERLTLAESNSASVPKSEEPDSWKQEVSFRLKKYKNRRREQIGQSTLGFNFESTTANHVFLQPEGARETTDLTDDQGEQFLTPAHLGSAAPELATGMPDLDTASLFAQPTRVVEEEQAPLDVPDVGKLIEFPRALYLGPAVNPHELADPVLETPRILDVPESMPAPPPPLSEIELEPAGEEVDPRLLEPVLDVAPLPQRVFASVVDCVVVLAAAALFGTIAVKIAGPSLLPDKRTALITAAIVPATLWAMYNYLFLVYGGRTLGMILARLYLVTFDTGPVRRATRTLRVVALQLSCLSLGLGLIWAFIDEDQICWHDRISHTYLRGR